MKPITDTNDADLIVHESRDFSFTFLVQKDWMYFLIQIPSMIPERRFLRLAPRARIYPPCKSISQRYTFILFSYAKDQTKIFRIHKTEDQTA